MLQKECQEEGRFNGDLEEFEEGKAEDNPREGEWPEGGKLGQGQDGLDERGVDLFYLLSHALEEAEVAEVVDAPWDPLGLPMDHPDGLVGEELPRRPGLIQAKVEIRGGFL